MAQLDPDVRTGLGVHRELSDLTFLEPAESVLLRPDMIHVDPLLGLVENLHPPLVQLLLESGAADPTCDSARPAPEKDPVSE